MPATPPSRSTLRTRARWLSLTLAALLAACATKPTDHTSPDDATAPAPDIATQPLRVPALTALPDTPARPLAGRYVAVDWSVLPGWQDDTLTDVWKALVNNCKGLMRPVSGSLAMPARAAPRVWQPVCAAVVQADPAAMNNGGPALRRFLEQHLRPWRLQDAAGKPARNTVTGYYEPVVHAARVRSGDHQWPLYQVPDDLITIDLGGLYPELAGKRIRGKLAGKRIVPYDTRAQIAANPQRQPPAIVWVNDPVEAFFLQIQGSGRAQLPNGNMIRLAYADHNGHPYVSIGQWLARQGAMPLAQTSMQNIKRWARDNPARVQEMLNANPAMVFFREEAIPDPHLGPKGAYGIPLAAQRAVAVDPTFVPLGTPLYLTTQTPGGAPLRRLVFAQDTGAAIKGAARTDFYWGHGEDAGAQAGRMKYPGEMWLLWPRAAGAPSAR